MYMARPQHIRHGRERETGGSVGARVSGPQLAGGERQNRRSGCGEHDRFGWHQPSMVCRAARGIRIAAHLIRSLTP